MASYNGIVDGVLHQISYWMECFSGLRCSFLIVIATLYVYDS